LELFKIFWKEFGFPESGRAATIDPWIKLVGNGNDVDEQLAKEITVGATAERQNRQDLRGRGLTPIYGQGWLTARRWEGLQPAPVTVRPVEKPMTEEDEAIVTAERTKAIESIKNLGNKMKVVTR